MACKYYLVGVASIKTANQSDKISNIRNEQEQAEAEVVPSSS